MAYLGIRQVDLGQYLNPGAAIVPLQSLDPIYVEFALPQQHLASLAVGKKLRIQRRRTSAATNSKARSPPSIPWSMTPRATSWSRARCTIPTTSCAPACLSTWRCCCPQQDGVLAIPVSVDQLRALRRFGLRRRSRRAERQAGPSEVEQQFVKLGPTRGDQVSVLSGLKDGDEVVTSGVFKLRPHAPVQVNNDVPAGQRA